MTGLVYHAVHPRGNVLLLKRLTPPTRSRLRMHKSPHSTFVAPGSVTIMPVFFIYAARSERCGPGPMILVNHLHPSRVKSPI